MYIIDDKLVSDDVLEQKFLCNLNACKGACCWEGDWGAPLDNEELPTLRAIYPALKPYLTSEGIAAIEKKGLYEWFEKPAFYGTTLLENGACAYLTYTSSGIAKCGIEKAWEDGAVDFVKPISCHLYPLRVTENEEMGFTALNYDEWDICSAACQLGKKEQLPLYQFVKQGIVRKFGENFYHALENAAAHAEE